LADTLTTTTTVSTIPSGTVIATDDAGAGGHVQIVKLALSADGSATAITADSNGLEVQGAGTAGTATGGVVTVQGVASMTPVQVADNGGSLTVDGTVTANLAAGTNNIGDVDVLTVPAPLSTTGGGTEATALRVTVASDSTGVLSVDDNGSTLSVDDGGGTLTVDGTVTANLAAGTNNIGDVDVLSVTPGTGAGDLGKAEDAPHASGDTGVMMLAVRRDTEAVGSGADGDYSTLNVTPSGNLRVCISEEEALATTFTAISAATSGDNTLKAAVASKKIRVTSLFLIAASAVTVRFESGAGGTALTGVMSLAANAGFVLPYNPVGWFETASNTLLNLELGGAVQVSGSFTHEEV
jgi:hypothetical protein